MRFSTFARWVIVLGVLAWAGYTVAAAGWNYLTTQEIVDKALREASGRHRAAFAIGSQIAVDALDTHVRNAILLDARHGGIPLDAEDVSVSANSAGISATVHWSFPVITYRGQNILVVPLSLQRSFVATPP
jgi:hypothetical protein